MTASISAIYRAKLVAQSVQGIQKAVLPGTDDQPVSCAGCGSCSMALPGQENKSDASSTVDYDNLLCKTRKHNQRI